MAEGEWEFSHARGEHIDSNGIIGYRGNDPKGSTFINHMSAGEIRRLVGDEIWDSYYKFCVIRNPFDKLVSGFQMLEKRKEKYTVQRKLLEYASRFLRMGNPVDLVTGETKVDRFRSWIKNGGWLNDRNKYLIKGAECMDFYIMFEDLENGVETVCNHLGVPFEPENIPKLKYGNRVCDISLSEYYDSETIKIVTNLYKIELDRFGYKAP